MKNTKTTIRELSARYRDILKKCFFLNAVAIGLFAATSASAAINVVTDVSGSSMANINKEMTNIESAVQSAARTAVKADLGTNTSDIYGATKTIAETAVLNALNTTSSDIYAASGNAAVDAVRSNIVDNTKPDASTYKYRDPSGNLVSLNDDGTASSADADYKTTSVAGTTGYTAVHVADGKSTITYTETTARDKDTYSFDSQSLTLDGGKFTFDDEGAVVVANGTTAYSDTAPGVVSGNYEFSAYNTTYTTAQTIKSDDDAPTVSVGQYKAVDTLHSTTYTLVYDPTDTEWADSEGYYLKDSAENKVKVEGTFLSDLKTAYKTDSANVAAAKQAVDTVASTNTTNYGLADTVYTKDNDARSNMVMWQASKDTKVSEYDTAEYNYEHSLAHPIANVAQTVVDNKVADISAAAYTGSSLADVNTYVTENATKVANVSTTAALIEDVMDAKEGLLSQDIGYNLADPDNADTGLVARLEALTDESQDKTLVGAINANTDAIAALKTEAETVFAEKQQWVDNTLGIVSANPDAVKTEYASTNYLKDAETLTGADIALDAQVKANADAIGHAKTADTEATGLYAYTDTAVANLETGAVLDNANAIEKLNGTVDTEGSVLYMIDGVVGHANTAAGKKPGDDGYTGSGLFAALDAEAVTRAEAITTVTNSLNAEVELRDAQIGDLASVATSGSSYLKPAAGGSTTNPPSVSEQLTTIGTTLEDVLGSADALKDVFAAAGESAPTNLAGYLTQQAAGAAQTQASNEARFAKLDSKINKLENKMEKGLAANNALAGLVPLDHVHKTQISAALGGYKSNQALAVGAFHYLNNRTLLNAGAAYGGNDSVSYKVGVTFGF